MPLNARTRQSVQEYLRDGLIRFAEAAPDISQPPTSLVDTLQFGAASGAAAPFHFALFPEIVRFKGLERSFSSALGGTFEELARIIALERFASATRQHVVRGRIRGTVSGNIDQIIKDYETVSPGSVRLRVPNAGDERALIRSLVGPGGEDFSEVVDLYLRGHDDSEHYFHMKTVKPNKDQANKAKRLMLRVYAMRIDHDPAVYFGMAYNPYGESNPYKWSFPKPYLDFSQEVLIGGAFWDYIGGTGTFDELVTLAMNTGRDLHEQIVRRLRL